MPDSTPTERGRPTGQEISERARELARQIGSRVYVTEEGAYLVRGSPEFEKLRGCLASLEENPEARPPGPVELGFAPAEIGRLDQRSLAAWGRGLQKWRKILERRESLQRVSSRERLRNAEWRVEIARLSAALEHLWTLLRAWEDGEALADAPYIRDPEGAPACRPIRMQRDMGSPVGRLVVWVAGREAGRRFEESLAARGGRPPAALVGAVAALCATDGAQSPIPFPPGAEGLEECVDQIRSLFAEHGQPGYEALLHALKEERLWSVPADNLREFLASGVDAGDAWWAQEHCGFSFYVLAEKGLSPKPLRRLVEILEATGLDRSALPLEHMAELIVSRGGVVLIESFASWLASLDPKALGPGRARWAWNCLYRLMNLQKGNPSLQDRLRSWARPPVQELRMQGPLEMLSEESRSWLARLGYYQTLCGAEPHLPGPLLRRLFAREREAGERAFLRAQRDAGRLDPPKAARLSHLESRAEAVRPDADRRIARQAQEACAHAALEAIGGIAQSEAERIWESQIGCDKPGHLSGEDIVAIAAWAMGLEKREKKHLRCLLEAWNGFGEAYRRSLPANLTWTERAAGRMDLDAWFHPAAHSAVIEGHPVQVRLAGDPFMTFLMGSYFGTCLSLDRDNATSALANAYEANKAVVFVLGPRGAPIARKLVAVNKEFRLVGYRTYVASERYLGEALRERIAALVDAWCGRLARAAGLRLGSWGEPERLSDLFWYDDGTEPWGAGSGHAWRDPAYPLEFEAPDGLWSPVLRAELDSRRGPCLEVLADLGIWPLPGRPEVRGLEELPDLAEESLVLVARQDEECARQILEEARTLDLRLWASRLLARPGPCLELAESTEANLDQEVLDRVLEGLYAAGTDRAHRPFIDLACRSNSSGNNWPPLVAGTSRVADAALTERLTKRLWCSWGTPILLVVAEGLRSAGLPLQQAAALGALVYYSDCIALAQWLPDPPCRFKPAQLRQIAGSPTFLYRRRPRLVPIFAAMNNPGPGSSAYLREAAGSDSSALLALALSGGRQYRPFIRSRALSTPAESAALLALIVSEGPAGAAELLRPTIGRIPGQAKRLENARALIQAFDYLDQGRPWVFHADSLNKEEAVASSPFALHRLRSWLHPEHPRLDAVSRLLASMGGLQTLESHGISLFGLAARLAGLLRDAAPEDESVLRDSLLNLLGPSPGIGWWWYAVLLDRLSRHRLFTGNRPGHPLLSWEASDSWPAIWACLRGRPGGELPALAWLDLETVGEWSLPSDPVEATRLLPLLLSLAPAAILREKARPRTQIDRYLLLRHLGQC